MLFFGERQKLGDQLLEVEQQIRSWVLWHPHGLTVEIQEALKRREEIQQRILEDLRERKESRCI